MYKERIPVKWMQYAKKVVRDPDKFVNHGPEGTERHTHCDSVGCHYTYMLTQGRGFMTLSIQWSIQRYLARTNSKSRYQKVLSMSKELMEFASEIVFPMGFTQDAPSAPSVKGFIQLGGSKQLMLVFMEGLFYSVHVVDGVVPLSPTNSGGVEGPFLTSGVSMRIALHVLDRGSVWDLSSNLSTFHAMDLKKMLRSYISDSDPEITRREDLMYARRVLYLVNLTSGGGSGDGGDGSERKGFARCFVWMQWSRPALARRES